jgi:hypothetical protein
MGQLFYIMGHIQKLSVWSLSLAANWPEKPSLESQFFGRELRECEKIILQSNLLMEVSSWILRLQGRGSCGLFF